MLRSAHQRVRRELREDVLQFLRENRTAVLSSVSPEGLPHASPISYRIDGDFRMNFVTKETTRKFAYCAQGRAVAVTVASDGPLHQSAQMNGRIAGVRPATEADILCFVSGMWNRPPLLPNFLKIPGYGLHCITIQIEQVQWYRASSTWADTMLTQIAVSRDTGVTPARSAR